MTVEDFTLPVINLEKFLLHPADPESIEEAKRAAQALHLYGALIIKDPRVSEEHNETFLNLMERYFQQPLDKKMKDVHSEYAYQVGATPEGIETPRCGFDPKCLSFIEQLSEENKPHMPTGPDPKWRFFWRIGQRPDMTDFKELNAAQVVPEAFPEWQFIMQQWGGLLHDAVETLAEMVAVGFGWPKETFSEMAKNGPHLLAPTGSNLSQHAQKDLIFAGFHYDLNFLTIHGKSRFPGLLIWTREGRKIPVKVPNGCLLVQAGKQMEYLTGGHVRAGYHEVVVLDSTLEALEKRKRQLKAQGRDNEKIWRVSSTLFYHIQSDQLLRPLKQFETKEALEMYPPIKTGQQVQKELEDIKLKSI